MTGPPATVPSAARRAMVARLAAPGDVAPSVLRAMAQVPREDFLPSAWRGAAYQDRAVPIGHGQSCSQPQIVAAVVTALRLAGGERVLEVGLGCGYQAAVLRAAGAASVVGIEWVPALAESARATLERLHVGGIEVRVGDGGLGAPDRAPFDAIVVSAAAPWLPPPLLAQLTSRGRLVLPLREGPELDHLWLVRRRPGGGWDWEPLGPCRFVPLLGGFGTVLEPPPPAPGTA